MTDSGGSIEGGTGNLGPSDLDSHSEPSADPEVEFFRRELYPMTQRAVMEAMPVLVRVRVLSPEESAAIPRGCSCCGETFPATEAWGTTNYVDFKITHPRYKRKNWEDMPRNPKSKRTRKKWGLL